MCKKLQYGTIIAHFRRYNLNFDMVMCTKPIMPPLPYKIYISIATSQDILKNFTPTKMLIPIAIGLAVVGFMFLQQFDAEQIKMIDWGWASVVFLSLALVIMVVRHGVLMWRLRVLTGEKLSWRQSFDVISLWESASAVTPSAAGGTAIALYFLHKEGIKGGETITLILFITFLDGLFFIIGLPFLWLFAGEALLSPGADIAGISGQDVLFGFFVLGYFFMMSYTIAIGYGLFVNSESLKWLMTKITGFLHKTTHLHFFERMREKSEALGDDIKIASEGIKTKNWRYWTIGFSTSAGAWILRFLVINFIIVALVAVSDHLLLFGRQFIIYILTLLAPTPGGAGVAEGAFQAFLTDFFPTNEILPDGTVRTNGSLLAITALIWRSISYYTYLALGVVVLPSWLKRVFTNKDKDMKAAEPAIV